MARRSVTERRRRAMARGRATNPPDPRGKSLEGQAHQATSPLSDIRRPGWKMPRSAPDATGAEGSANVSRDVAGTVNPPRPDHAVTRVWQQGDEPVSRDLVPHPEMRQMTPVVRQQAWVWLIGHLPPATQDGLADTWPDEDVGWRVLGRRLSALVSGVASGLFGRRSRLVRRYNTAVMGLLAALLVIGVTGIALASSAIAKGAHGWMGLAPAAVSATPTATAGVIVVHSAPELTPTPVLAHYRIGAWVSNSSPGSSGTIKVYVSVRDGITPLAKISVKVHAVYTCAAPSNGQDYGPATTDADGIATIPVTFSGLPVGAPVCVTATVTIEQQTYTATTTFAAG